MRSSKVHLVVGVVLSLIGLLTVGSVVATILFLVNRGSNSSSIEMGYILLVAVLIFGPFIFFGIRCIRSRSDERHLGNLMLPKRIWRLVVGALYLILGGFFLIGRWISSLQSLAHDSTQIGLGLALTMLAFGLVLIFSPSADRYSLPSKDVQALDGDIMD